jgi:hypothetical protein
MGRGPLPGCERPIRPFNSGKGTLKVTGTVNVVEQRDPPRSPSPLWELSFGRKCRARNLIGCDGELVMLQCEKLMSLGLLERREVLEKSGLCMFCLKHAAELECYGRGGLSKPRCKQLGCNGEHTPGVHKLMGEERASVNLVAEDGDEDEDKGEDEDEGWWVGTVGVAEVPDWVEETPHGVPSPEQEDGLGEAESGCQAEEKSECPLSDCSTDEVTEDRWWELESTHSSFEKGGSEAQQPRSPQRPPSDAAWPPPSVGVKRRKLRKRPGTSPDQDWEEARRSAWLRQMLNDTSSDEDEERYGRFAESGRWMAELFKIPRHPVTTSEGECSG